MRFYSSLSSVSRLSAVCLLISLPHLAQGPIVSQDTLVGWAVPVSPSTNGSLDIQSTQKCPHAKRVCKQMFQKTQFAWSGGTAYDPRHQSVWISDGAVLVEYQVKGCKGNSIFYVVTQQ